MSKPEPTSAVAFSAGITVSNSTVIAIHCEGAIPADAAEAAAAALVQLAQAIRAEARSGFFLSNDGLLNVQQI
jgi:hypothetical protein